MPGKLKAARKRATSRTDTSVGKSRHIRRSISPILLKFREVFPRQTALELALRTGAALRHCERCLGGGGDLGWPFMEKLLQSDFGQHAWSTVMEGCKQPWFARIQRLSGIANMRGQVAKMTRAIEQLEREAGE